jgi:hypothetical protein
MIVVTFLWLAWLILAAQLGYLQAQDPPYKGKTIRVIVGFPAGGGSDAEGRVITRHLGKYTPGGPSLIVQNMSGAGGPDGFQLVQGTCQARRISCSGLPARGRTTRDRSKPANWWCPAFSIGSLNCKSTGPRTTLAGCPISTSRSITSTRSIVSGPSATSGYRG